MSHQIDIEKVRADFPILSRKVNGHPLVYFDNAATSQTPKVVIDAIVSITNNIMPIFIEVSIAYLKKQPMLTSKLVKH